MKLLSFVIPCYGGARTVGGVIEEIISVVSERSEYDYEIIAVNDCSPDNAWLVLNEIAAENRKVKLVDFAKNSNRPAAVMAGLALAKGDVCVVLDDDGQCPTPELWRLLEPLDKGYDVSIAAYPERKQSLFKNFGTVVNQKMTEIVINRPKNLQFTNFMALKSFIAKKMVEYQNPYPYLTGLILRTTQRIANVGMEQRGRMDGGKTNFTLKKMLGLWLNGFTAFSLKPLRVATILGCLFAFAGFVFGIFTIVRKIVEPDILAWYSSLMAVLLFVSGMIMLLLGLIGEYLGRIYISINNSPQYVIRQTVNIEEVPSHEVYDEKV